MVKNVSYCWTDILLKEQTSARFTTKNNVRIKSHNKNILGHNESKSWKTSFIYRDNKPCPLNDNCLHQRVICIQETSWSTETILITPGWQRLLLKIDFINIKTLLNMRTDKTQRNCLTSKSIGRRQNWHITHMEYTRNG